MKHTDLSGFPEISEFIRDREKVNFRNGILLMALTAVFVSAAVMFSQYKLISVLLGICLLIFIFFRYCFKRLRILSDRDYECEITDIKKKTVSGGKAQDAGDVPDRFRVRMKVRDDTGKVRTFVYYNEEADSVKNFYAVGDRVYHHKGLPGFEKEIAFEDEALCLCCLRTNPGKKTVCDFCGRPLIR